VQLTDTQIYKHFSGKVFQNMVWHHKPRSKLLKSPFFPILTFILEFRRLS